MARSIATRIRRALLGLALGLTLLLAAVALLVLYVTEDQLFMNQLLAERVVLEQAPAAALDTWQPGSRHMQLFWDEGELPAALRQAVGEAPGVYEHFDARDAFFVLKGRLAEPPRDYLLVYDVSDLLSVRKNRPALLVLLAIGVLVVGVIATLVALYLAKKTLHPLRRLTRELEPGAGGDLPDAFAAEFAGDEVGVLASALESALQRVRASARREFEFNRGVSHELRSPIQVAKNAVELMAMGEPSGAASAPAIARLTRAVEQMENITEAFLWLASDRTLQPSRVNARDAIDKVIDDCRQAFGAAMPEVSVQAEDVEFPVPLPVFRVIAGNLLRNAVQHAADGHVRCSVTNSELVIENQSSDDTGHGGAAGYGVGLEIVERICERLGWTLALTSPAAGGVRASVRLLR